jgi:hypothetical protein
MSDIETLLISERNARIHMLQHDDTEDMTKMDSYAMGVQHGIDLALKAYGLREKFDATYENWVEGRI